MIWPIQAVETMCAKETRCQTILWGRGWRIKRKGRRGDGQENQEKKEAKASGRSKKSGLRRKRGLVQS